MSYNIVLTTAEDVVAVVDAVVAKGTEASKEFVSEFTGIATDDQVQKALQMALELQLVTYDAASSCYKSDSFFAKRLCSTSSDEQKAAFMRLILEQYPPFITFKTRYGFCNSIDIACRQTKTIYSMSSNERDIKNTLISIATYAKALKSEGAGLYSFVDNDDTLDIINLALHNAAITETALRSFWGEPLCSFVNDFNVFQPLAEALQKTQAEQIDTKAIIVYAANAFESFLGDLASNRNISLSGRSGIIQKRDALSGYLSKKHRGMIDFIGQVRNAADHGADAEEGNQTWIVSRETAMLFPAVVALLIKDIYSREFSSSIEV